MSLYQSGARHDCSSVQTATTTDDLVTEFRHRPTSKPSPAIGADERQNISQYQPSVLTIRATDALRHPRHPVVPRPYSAPRGTDPATLTAPACGSGTAAVPSQAAAVGGTTGGGDPARSVSVITHRPLTGRRGGAMTECAVRAGRLSPGAGTARPPRRHTATGRNDAASRPIARNGRRHKATTERAR